eukprot:1372217-Amphidinium_carterae.1
MLSGRSMVVVSDDREDAEDVLCGLRLWLNLPDDSMLELWHGQDRVPEDGKIVRDWPGIQPLGEISEYQLLVRRDESDDSA